MALVEAPLADGISRAVSPPRACSQEGTKSEGIRLRLARVLSSKSLRSQEVNTARKRLSESAVISLEEPTPRRTAGGSAIVFSPQVGPSPPSPKETSRHSVLPRLCYKPPTPDHDITTYPEWQEAERLAAEIQEEERKARRRARAMAVCDLSLSQPALSSP